MTTAKVLSANDTGETGGHQAGLLVPKNDEILSFFPTLNPAQKNPRAHLLFRDDLGKEWEFAFIYYNNKFFGGTRNEFRLTRMTAYLREARLVSGDEILLSRDSDGKYAVSHRRAASGNAYVTGSGKTVLSLGSGWKIIDIQ